MITLEMGQLYGMNSEKELMQTINELKSAGMSDNNIQAILDRSKTEFHCGIEESGFHAYNCNDCPNKCDVYYQWDKEMKKKGMTISDHIEVLKSYRNGFTGWAGNLQDSIDVAVDIMNKYRRIQEIMNELNGNFYGSYLKDRQTLEKIYEVLEDEHIHK